MNDPQQEIFTALKLAIESLGYDVYDGFLPPEETPYPFVYLGDFRQYDTQNKTCVTGSVYPTIHVWSNTPKNRGTVSGMLLDIKKVMRNIEHTESFAWMCRNVTQDILTDKTTKQSMLHGVVSAELMFS